MNECPTSRRPLSEPSELTTNFGLMPEQLPARTARRWQTFSGRPCVATSRRPSAPTLEAPIDLRGSTVGGDYSAAEDGTFRLTMGSQSLLHLGATPSPGRFNTTALHSGVVAIQWHAVFDDAMRSSDVVAVWAAVEDFLGRPGTTAELSAARRAANQYAAVSNVQILRVRAPLGGRGDRSVLMLARADADFDDSDRLRDIALASPPRQRRRPQGRRTSNVAQRAETVAANLTKLAGTTRRLSAGQLDPSHAAALAEDIAAALPDLVQFQRRLRLRGETLQPTAGAVASSLVRAD